MTSSLCSSHALSFQCLCLKKRAADMICLHSNPQRLSVSRYGAGSLSRSASNAEKRPSRAPSGSLSRVCYTYNRIHPLHARPSSVQPPPPPPQAQRLSSFTSLPWTELLHCPLLTCCLSAQPLPTLPATCSLPKHQAVHHEIKKKTPVLRRQTDHFPWAETG